MALEEGELAPDFSLLSTDGETFTLSKNWANTGGIIFFYPKDFTPGCTAEVCEFRDMFDDLKKINVPVIGISSDNIMSHLKFKAANKLPFDLLADTEGVVRTLYKAKYGLFSIPKRITYRIDANHKIISIFDSMFDAKGHANGK